MRETRLTEEPKPEGKKVPPGAMIGVGVAIGASLLAVFITTSNRDKDERPPPAQAAAADPADDQTAQVQFGQNGQTTPPPAPATPDPGAPVANAEGALAFTDETISFSATIPPGPETDPVLTYLRTDALAYFAKYKANAHTDAEDRKREGAMAMPWEVLIEWKYTAKAGDVVSLVGTAYEFTGGAHGMTYTDTHIAKAATGEQITIESMLTSGALSPAIVIGVCEALKKVKLEKIGSATIYDEPIVCAGTQTNIKLEEAKVALAPSTETNKFGGMLVYYDAYAVGPYAEGSYSLALPHEIFVEDLRPEYKALFGGKLAGEP
jgi:hypothetical protein